MNERKLDFLLKKHNLQKRMENFTKQVFDIILAGYSDEQKEKIKTCINNGHGCALEVDVESEEREREMEEIINRRERAIYDTYSYDVYLMASYNIIDGVGMYYFHLFCKDIGRQFYARNIDLQRSAGVGSYSFSSNEEFLDKILKSLEKGLYSLESDNFDNKFKDSSFSNSNPTSFMSEPERSSSHWSTVEQHNYNYMPCIFPD